MTIANRMSVLIKAVLVLIFPVQLFLYGLFLVPLEHKNAEYSQIKNQVQGASTSVKENRESSLKGKLSDSTYGNENSGGAGLIPQRKKSYYDEKIFASASVVIDVDSGTILHYDNGRLKMPIASLTKMMTAIVVIEKVKDLNETVTIDEEALSVDGTKVGCPRSGYCIDERLHIGEKLTVNDLLTAMLLNSANDAAVALGKHIAGSQKEFAKLMNEKARELNLRDSNFRNPSGLDEENFYSSAYDIARATAYSMRYDKIWEIMKIPKISITSTDGKYTHNLKNTDVIMNEIPNCLGGKTGFTYEAGKSLMMAAADPVYGRHRVVAVILNDNDRWIDMKRLIAWTFENYEWK